MNGDTGAEDVEDIVVRLRAEFPEWRIVHVGGRWWATRGCLVREDLNQVTADAYTPDGLRAKIRELCDPPVIEKAGE